MDKNKMGNNENQEPVVVNTNSKKIVAKQTAQVIDTKTIDDHLKENRDKIKVKVDYKEILMYTLMVIIVIVCGVLLLHFCGVTTDENIFEKKTIPTTIRTYPPTTTTIPQISYKPTTTLKTQATHTAMPQNTTPPRVPEFTGTRTTTRTKTTTTTTTTTTTIETTTESDTKPEE